MEIDKPNRFSVFEYVQMFIKKFGFAEEKMTLDKINFAINGLITEEYNELIEAWNNHDSEEMIDALGDITWLCIKLMYQLNVDPHEVFKQIGKANLSKVRGIKPGREQSGGFDVIKPSNWTGPDHSKNHGDLDEIFSSSSSS